MTDHFQGQARPAEPTDGPGAAGSVAVPGGGSSTSHTDGYGFRPDPGTGFMESVPQAILDKLAGIFRGGTAPPPRDEPEPVPEPDGGPDAGLLDIPDFDEEDPVIGLPGGDGEEEGAPIPLPSEEEEGETNASDPWAPPFWNSVWGWGVFLPVAPPGEPDDEDDEEDDEEQPTPGPGGGGGGSPPPGSAAAIQAARDAEAERKRQDAQNKKLQEQREQDRRRAEKKQQQQEQAEKERQEAERAKAEKEKRERETAENKKQQQQNQKGTPLPPGDERGAPGENDPWLRLPADLGHDPWTLPPAPGEGGRRGAGPTRLPGDLSLAPWIIPIDPERREVDISETRIPVLGRRDPWILTDPDRDPSGGEPDNPAVGPDGPSRL